MDRDGERQVLERTSVVVLAAPFRAARRLRSFIDAVKRLPGVEAIALISFRRGTLRFTVTYADALPLGEQLAGLSGFDLAIEQSDGQISVRLPDPREGC